MLGSAVSLEGSSPSRSRFIHREPDMEEMGLMCVFVCRLIQHTKALMSAEEKLCIKVLRILQEMLIRTLDFDEKVRSNTVALLLHFIFDLIVFIQPVKNTESLIL